MFRKLVPLNREAHAAVRIQPVESFGFAAGLQHVSIMVHEFARAASVYPIVFLEDFADDGFRPVVLLGLEPGDNLFLSADGRWQASYIPAIIRRYPFALARLEEDADRFTVCLDEAADCVGVEVGEALFDAIGEPTRIVDHVKRYLGEMQQMDVYTRQFCRFLGRHNLFRPLDMQIHYRGRARTVSGCHVINEERLTTLSDPLFLELRDRRFLAPVFSQILSLGQIERLAHRKEDRVSVARQADNGSPGHPVF